LRRERERAAVKAASCRQDISNNIEVLGSALREPEESLNKAFRVLTEP
jgi:hypothetical protein